MKIFGLNDKGVTIIELIIVTVLIAILAAFALPQFQKVALRQEFISQVDAVMDDLRVAQSSARNSIEDKQVDPLLPPVPVVAYQFIPILDGEGYEIRQLLENGNTPVIATNNLALKRIAITMPAEASGGFQFNVPSGRTADLTGDPYLNVKFELQFLHAGLQETISVSIDPSGTISR